MTAESRKELGFTLLETLVATAVGIVIVGTGAMLFQSANQMSQTSVTRSDMQQSARSAIAIITRDLTQASIGIPQAGINVPSGAGSTAALYGCGPLQCYLKNGTYPNNLLAPVTPGDAQGAGGSDAVMVAYIDNSWPVKNQDLTAVAQDGSSITVNTATFDVNGNPAPSPTGHAYDDPVFGSRVGDVMMVWNTNGYAVATVTGIAKNGVLNLNNGGPLNLNQSAAAAGNIPGLRNADTTYPKTSAARINVVTYFIQMQAGADGVVGTADDIPVLMRQVNAQNAIPVAENVQSMAITYDIYDDSTSTYKTALDGAAVLNSSEIRKVNITLTLVPPAFSNSKENYTLSTSVSPRDLSFKNRYE